mmetsp:Transcript_31141/g.28336  ORF Transcript_31141/g.28336 Transcript_31141/m.28336 type:complete len:152 (+) Transcript_31141:554-1009(+)
MDDREFELLETITNQLQISWKKLARHAFHLIYKKSGEDFVEHYFNQLHKKECHKNKPFSPEEDKEMVDWVAIYGRDWKKISAKMAHKEPIMLKNRYYYLTKKGIVDRETNRWTYGEMVYGSEDVGVGKHGRGENASDDEEEQNYTRKKRQH